MQFSKQDLGNFRNDASDEVTCNQVLEQQFKVHEPQLNSNRSKLYISNEEEFDQMYSKFEQLFHHEIEEKKRARSRNSASQTPRKKPPIHSQTQTLMIRKIESGSQTPRTEGITL